MTWRRHPRSASADDLLTALGRLTERARKTAESQKARVELAEALQRSMLPTRLPAVPGLQVAARYAPARNGLDIGGDWYDGFLLPDGSLGLSIGDVQGHDVEAAAVMGQIRIGLRAVATATTDPGEILRRANDLLLSVDQGLFATCSFLRFDPATAVVESARAGHVPAVWASPGGCGLVEDETGVPLGIVPGESYPVVRRRLSRGAALVLVTDGVVEGPAYPIEAGLEAVSGLVGSAVGQGASAGELAAAVMGVAALTEHTDDAAVLVLMGADGRAAPG
ncbi:PP2C family protein-serine/threonine phosphatase [Streptomyces genisteinicus]|uniref:Serine/threonine-protein phosphatase n=1 Tax=Streptomyces genisteinicus TaxID=2768068 RepID=A0A7H0HMP8_9ACTN|nr:PP2C family protein-serine/threonine phosphatase [Streptomyces genisteinicus]QNP61814.1 serine/threonine-protein phosphatase [Streptomyces genisteinicus]